MPKTLPTTGINPAHANTGRRYERELDKACLNLRITSNRGRISRRRKKALYATERGLYRALLVSVAKDLAMRRAG